MAGNSLERLNPGRIETPAFVVFENELEENLRILRRVKESSGASILLALKAFSSFHFFPLLSSYLDGTCASSVNEARLGREYFGREVHAHGPAFSTADMETLSLTVSHISLNSFRQLELYREMLLERGVSVGLRVNPGYSSAPVPMYDPCAPNSRLGIVPALFKGRDTAGVEGLHFHSLCEQNADALEKTLESFEREFAGIIPAMKWINFGGGHHITRSDYDRELLVELIRGFTGRYGVNVYLEPGEAAALNAGILAATVLDIITNGMDIAVLDISAAAHTPDVLEMPYRPGVYGAGIPGEKACTFRLAGNSCLAGDVIGDYSFDNPLEPGDKILFLDMAHYTIVKTNTFNGVALPSVMAYNGETDRLSLVKKFGYDDFKNRLS